jgi:hypothetical protein
MKVAYITFKYGREGIFEVATDDIVESFWGESLSLINKKDVKKYKIRDGLKLSNLGGTPRRIAGILDRASCTSCYVEDYIRLDDIMDRDMYYDTVAEAFISGDTLKAYADTQNYLWWHDGRNWRVDEIETLVIVEPTEIDGGWSYNTGELYARQVGGLKFLVHSSRYQGSLDEVECFREEGTDHEGDYFPPFTIDDLAEAAK